jgi:molybdenum cofactor sulfurtransferase
MKTGERVPLRADRGVEDAYADFLVRYPTYSKTYVLDGLRSTEYCRLDEQRQVYLDYTGGALYGESQVRKHVEILRAGVFGNPHSSNPTSVAITDHIERTRRYVLTYFNASPDDYIVVFTQNATAALKLIGESFPFSSGGRLLLTFDNHNSVNGIREFARARGAAIDYAPLAASDLRVDQAQLEALFDQADTSQHNLFAFPAQSNFSGVQHPLELVAHAQRKGWDVLLDAAAFVPTNPSRSECGASGFRVLFLLQDVWLPNWCRRITDPPFHFYQIEASMVCGRDGEFSVRARPGTCARGQ